MASLEWAVTKSRVTNGGRRKDRNTSGQRGNKFNTWYRDISVIVAENNRVVKPKYQQYTSLNNMLSNFSKVLMAHISFTAVINNGGIGKGIGGIRKGTEKELYLRFVTYCVTCVTKKENQNRGPRMNSPTLPQKIFKFFATSPVPIRRSGQAFMVIGPRIAVNYGLQIQVFSVK